MKQFDYFVSGEDIPGIVYWNKSERYGPDVRVTVTDYLELNPTGDFHIDPVAHEIREYFNDGSYVVVANSGI